MAFAICHGFNTAGLIILVSANSPSFAPASLQVFLYLIICFNWSSVFGRGRVFLCASWCFRGASRSKVSRHCSKSVRAFCIVVTRDSTDDIYYVLSNASTFIHPLAILFLCNVHYFPAFPSLYQYFYRSNLRISLYFLYFLYISRYFGFYECRYKYR